MPVVKMSESTVPSVTVIVLPLKDADTSASTPRGSSVIAEILTACRSSADVSARPFVWSR